MAALQNTFHFRICTFLVGVPARVVAQLQHGMLTSALAGSISPSALADMSRVSIKGVVAERGFVEWLPSGLIACVHMMIVTFANTFILSLLVVLRSFIPCFAFISRSNTYDVHRVCTPAALHVCDDGNACAVCTKRIGCILQVTFFGFTPPFNFFFACLP